MNPSTGWYEMFYRNYDPVIGKKMQIDPYASMYDSYSTYNYALNNPIMVNDPSGGQSRVYDGLPPIADGRSDMLEDRMNKIYRYNEYAEWFEGGGGSQSLLSFLVKNGYLKWGVTDSKNRPATMSLQLGWILGDNAEPWTNGSEEEEQNLVFSENVFDSSETGVQMQQQNPVPEYNVLLRSEKKDIFGEKISYVKDGKTTIIKTVVVVTFNGNYIKNTEGFRIVTTVLPFGWVNHTGSSIPKNQSGQLILSDGLGAYIKTLENFWRPKTLMEQYRDFLLSKDEPVKGLDSGSSPHR